MTDGDRVRYRRSPLLLVGWEGADLILTQCDSLRRYRVDEQLLGLLGCFSDWREQDELDPQHIDGPAVLLDQLHDMGVLDRDQEPATTRIWSPFDLVVQRQQNRGGEREPADLQGPPPPAFKDRPPGLPTSLPAPSPLPMRLDDVLAARRSVRTYGAGPITLDVLSCLLYHSARVIEVVDDEHLGEQALHPYPTGGARSELEVYVVANDVEGVERGAHWYDARRHELRMIRPVDDELQAVNDWVSEATGGLHRPPQVILLVTAVFERVMWKYHGIGLSLIARDTGCLYQTLYLVATGLGLAPCAVGAGRELDNARWLGLDPLVESPVGCVLVGTAQHSPAAPPAQRRGRDAVAG